MQQFRSIFVLFTLFCYLSNNKNGGCHSRQPPRYVRATSQQALIIT